MNPNIFTCTRILIKGNEIVCFVLIFVQISMLDFSVFTHKGEKKKAITFTFKMT